MIELTGPPKGTLALVGSGEYMPGMADVDRFLLERISGDPRVVCMPTAAGQEGPASIGHWSTLGTDHFTGLGVQAGAVEVVDRDSAMDDSLAEQIASANFVYLSGGDANYLHHTLVGTKAHEAILGVLERGGVVAGCSAGAMIWGERIPRLLPPPWPWRRGFGMVPGTTILPHYNEIPAWLVWGFHAINSSRPTMVGIDGYTALVFSDGAPTVRGRGSVTIWERGGKQRYTGGDST